MPTLLALLHYLCVPGTMSHTSHRRHVTPLGFHASSLPAPPPTLTSHHVSAITPPAYHAYDDAGIVYLPANVMLPITLIPLGEKSLDFICCVSLDLPFIIEMMALHFIQAI